nr:MAG TPA: hypothetical protein [Caudoviricetes sp.]
MLTAYFFPSFIKLVIVCENLSFLVLLVFLGLSNIPNCV